MNKLTKLSFCFFTLFLTTVFNYSYAIINGSQDWSKFPGVVKIKIFHNVNSKYHASNCTGTLIKKDKILTSAHCIINKFKNLNTKSIKKIEVKYNGNDYKFINDQFGLETSIYKDQRDCEDCTDNLFIRNDIAIIDLKYHHTFRTSMASVGDNKAFFNNNPNLKNHVIKVRENIPTPGKLIYMVGFGCTYKGGNAVDKRLYAKNRIKVVNAFFISTIQNSEFDSATCSGDSGGPLIQKINSVFCSGSPQKCTTKKEYKIIGVTSSSGRDKYNNIISKWTPLWNINKTQNQQKLFKRTKEGDYDRSTLKLATDPKTKSHYGQDNWRFVNYYINN